MGTHFRVTISAAAGTAPADGFIDPTKLERYMAEGGVPANLAASLAKERANLRYVRMIEQLQLIGNLYVTNIVATGADVNTAPTTLAFTVTVEHGADSLVIEDIDNPGTTLTGANAIRTQIARSLTQTFTRPSDYYDPTATATPGNASTHPRYGNRIQDVTVGAPAADLATALALVAVAEIAFV